MVDIAQLLHSYPRKRSILSTKYGNIYKSELLAGRVGTSLMHRLVLYVESWMHRKVASRSFVSNHVLEIGAGTLNHLKYEMPTQNYDVIEPNAYFFAGSNNMSKINALFKSMQDVPVDSMYDRIISIAVLEHLVDLPSEIALSGMRLNKNGIFQAGIPCEGEVSWTIASHLTTGLAFRIRTGLSYLPIIRYEHINSAAEIIELVKYFYKNVAIKRFPLPFKNLSFYIYLEATSPKLDICHDYIQDRRFK